MFCLSFSLWFFCWSHVWCSAVQKMSVSTNLQSTYFVSKVQILLAFGLSLLLDSAMEVSVGKLDRCWRMLPPVAPLRLETGIQMEFHSLIHSLAHTIHTLFKKVTSISHSLNHYWIETGLERISIWVLWGGGEPCWVTWISEDWFTWLNIYIYSR